MKHLRIRFKTLSLALPQIKSCVSDSYPPDVPVPLFPFPFEFLFLIHIFLFNLALWMQAHLISFAFFEQTKNAQRGQIKNVHV